MLLIALDAFHEALLLHLLGHIQKQLDHPVPVFIQILLPVPQLLIPLLKEVLRDAPLRDMIALFQVMHLHHQHILILTAVEHPDLSPGRERAVDAPQIVMAQFRGVGCLEGMHFQRSRVQCGEHLLDQAVLAGRVPGLNGHHKSFLAGSIQLFLQYGGTLQIVFHPAVQFGLLLARVPCRGGCRRHVQPAASVIKIIFQGHSIQRLLAVSDKKSISEPHVKDKQSSAHFDVPGHITCFSFFLHYACAVRKSGNEIDMSCRSTYCSVKAPLYS